MPKTSIGKVLTALFISCLYIYLFGIVQVVEVTAVSENEIQVEIPEDKEAPPQTTPGTNSGPTVKPLGMKKPAMGDYTAITTADTVQTAPPETDDDTIRVPQTTFPHDSAVIPPPSSDTSLPVPEETQPAETPYEYPDTPSEQPDEPEYTEPDEPEETEPEYSEPEEPEETEPEYSEPDEPEETEPEYSEPEEPEETEPEYSDPEEPAETEPEDSDPEEPAETEPEDSDPEEPAETEPEDSDPEEPEESDNETSSNGDITDITGEEFTVYDMVTDTYYTGPAREIVARAVVGEIWNEFPDEAVKAQAVATYTYIKKSNEMGIRPETALKTDVYDRIYDLVDEVLGEAMYYDGELIQCVFFASSCGYTNSSLNVWGVEYPYLVSVDCPLDESTDPNWGSTTTYTSDEVRKMVLENLGIALSDDPSQWFRIISRLDDREHGWVTSISVGGMTMANGKPIDGRVMRETVFSYGLKSAAFDISYDSDADTFTFTTYGHGHGVGLSQYGAKALAENGYNYKQILQHYFTGVEIY